MERVVIKKNGRERIEISVQEFGGKPFLDIRAYYFDAEKNEWKPTKKGIAVAPDLVKPVLRGIKKVGAPFLELPEPESTGIERKAKKKKRDHDPEAGVKKRIKQKEKEQQRLKRELTKAVAGDDLKGTEKEVWEATKKRLNAASEELSKIVKGAKKTKPLKNLDAKTRRLIEESAMKGVETVMKRVKRKVDAEARAADEAMVTSIKKPKLKSKSKPESAPSKKKSKKLKEAAPVKKHKRPRV